MAAGATVHTFEIALSDVDRGVYEKLAFKAARHPSEAAEFLVARVLAYCLEYEEGISFSRGLAEAEEPAVWVRFPDGRVKLWIEVGLPDAGRLHRAAKAAGRVAVYTHRGLSSLLRNLERRRIHRAEEIRIVGLPREVVDPLAARLDRRTALDLSVSDRTLYVGLGPLSLAGRLDERRLA